ncbi:lysylphosphatidylglycerol synthase domain-containing protein [Azospirillum rugosum]|uniref:Phosphatidylglycerol lysyltransferase n=1 Tax=Azospirillum rugosum TaxID=416170 RepID=A0ABS4SVN3_9PROT|nr:lysylphosphatidylglycerol synthase domain-containing protein [Azospirillum rugosum]MBP2296123.1 phosphatidylglycerol lysyltransferase [Azospirillum rugosum]MDQ0530804.1 phosphatidylglycerol lysyltransferase [Azospirillum rugosum]
MVQNDHDRDRDPGAEPAVPEAGTTSRTAVLVRYGTGLLILALLAGALLILNRWLEHTSVEDIRQAIRRIDARQLLMAVSAAAVSYWLLTLYDLLALRHLRRAVPYRWVAFTAFTSYAFSHSLGFASIIGATVRYRLYAPRGLGAVEVAQVTLFVVTTFTLGLAAVMPVVMLVDPTALKALHVPPRGGVLLGLSALALLAAYAAAGLWLRRPLRIFGHAIAFPRPSIAVGQLLLGLCDLALASSVLYFCLPASDAVTYMDVVVAFGLALVAGIISHVPGGLGVFDAIVLVSLTPEMPGNDVMAGLLVFRLIYYLAPLILAGLMFGAMEAFQARHRISRVSRSLSAPVSPVVPLVLAACTFITGAFLLFSRATPEESLPAPFDVAALPLVEMSHFTGSVVGILLILLAHAIQRRLHAAWVLSLVLLAVGSVSSLLKGGDWQEAIVPGLIFLALLPARGEFHRRGNLLGNPLPSSWFVAIGVALGSAFWLGLFSYKHVAFNDELWWHFALHGDASRFLRASVAVGVIALCAAVVHLVRAATQARPGRNPAGDLPGGDGERHCEAHGGTPDGGSLVQRTASHAQRTGAGKFQLPH